MGGTVDMTLGDLDGLEVGFDQRKNMFVNGE